jgi:hypothetical protein
MTLRCTKFNLHLEPAFGVSTINSSGTLQNKCTGKKVDHATKKSCMSTHTWLLHPPYMPRSSSSNIKTQNPRPQVHLDDVFWYQFDGEHWSPITLTAEPESSSAVKMLELAARQNVTIARGGTLPQCSSVGRFSLSLSLSLSLSFSLSLSLSHTHKHIQTFSQQI